MSERILMLVHADRRHGVARYARDLARRVSALAGDPVAVAEPDWPTAVAAAADAGRPVHAQFTDRLWAGSPEAAADRFVALADTARSSSPRRIGVTLHDVPQPSDGHAFERRIAAYRRVADAASVVVVNSEHERCLLGDHLDRRFADEAVVIHLPVDRARPAPRVAVLEPAAAVLGFVYPGKGHAETIDAIADRGLPLEFHALGGASSGHEADAADLIERGDRRGVRVRISGFLAEAELSAAMARVAVPVVAHRHFSASGSINSWIAAGRRPLVVRTRYTEEVSALRPGTVSLVDAAELGSAIERARRDPESTFLARGTSIRPDWDDVAARYVDLLTRSAAS